MNRAPHNKVPYFQSRFERRQIESSSTQKNNKPEIDDRAERDSSLIYLHNPSTPQTDEELECFIIEAAKRSGEELDQLKAGRSKPC